MFAADISFKMFVNRLLLLRSVLNLSNYNKNVLGSARYELCTVGDVFI